MLFIKKVCWLKKMKITNFIFSPKIVPIQYYNNNGIPFTVNFKYLNYIGTLLK